MFFKESVASLKRLTARKVVIMSSLIASLWGPRGHINEQQMISFLLKCNENVSVIVSTSRVFVRMFADDDLLS